MRPENGAAQARDAHLARIPEPFGAIEAASLRNDGRYHHAVDLGSWMCFQASSAGPSAYCFAFSRKEGMSSKHCRAGPSRCSPARSGRVGLPLPRWLLPEVNSRSYAPRLRRVGFLRIELGARCPFYLDGAGPPLQPPRVQPPHRPPLRRPPRPQAARLSSPDPPGCREAGGRPGRGHSRVPHVSSSSAPAGLYAQPTGRGRRSTEKWARSLL